jgi:ribosomal protein L34E
MEPLLDTNSNNVYCATCGNEIKGITPFAKTQMKSLGQTMKNRQVQKVFSVNCGNCRKITQPQIINGKVVCKNCEQPLNVTPHFVAAMQAAKS